MSKRPLSLSVSGTGRAEFVDFDALWQIATEVRAAEQDRAQRLADLTGLPVLIGPDDEYGVRAHPAR